MTTTATVPERQNITQRGWTAIRGIFRSKSSKIGAAILIAILLVLGAGLIGNHIPPNATNSGLNRPPSSSHIFGTDWLGHDLYSQIVWGAGPSLFVAIVGALGSVVLGLMAGVFTGYFRKLQGPLGGISDIIMVFPVLPLLILIGSLFQPSDLFIASLLVLVLWPVVARTIRAQVAAIKRLPFIDAAKMSGLSDIKIVFRIIIPEVAAIAIAYFIVNVSFAVVLTTALEFLGVGNPDVVSWGSILYWAQQFGFIAGDWWWVAIPGAFITMLATGFALIGFSFEETINPRLRSIA